MKKQVLFILLNALAIYAFAQSNIHAGGGNASGSSGSVSWSIGQMNYHAATGTNGKVNTGVQLPFEILITTGLSETSINLIASAYPNPASDNLMLLVESGQAGNLTWQLHDLEGKLLKGEVIQQKDELISLTGLADAAYVLSIMRENKTIKTFRIIKRQL